MKRILVFLYAAAAGIAFFSCASGSAGSGQGLPPKVQALKDSAVFEVLLKKPPEEPQVQYEKELDWEKVPFSIRSDEYYPIGTAFAISKTELMTAFHVIDLGSHSKTFEKYYIRDAQKTVYEVDTIVGGSNEKDFLIFTVKGRTFKDFFELQKDFRTDETVYSIGNALGEGNIVRVGSILNTIPEPESGRWDLLRTSAQGNPGNSGGPLVTTNGKAVAVVTSGKDNILYSVPMKAIDLEGVRKTKTLTYRLKQPLVHFILPNRTYTQTYEISLPVPGDYQSLRDTITAGAEKNYAASMEALFKEAPEYLTGPNNRYVLATSLNSTFPQLDFVDSNDEEWSLVNWRPSSVDLPDDGRLFYTESGGWNVYKIKKPKSVPIAQIEDPAYCMDLILQHIRRERALGGVGYRILSLGQPTETASYTDALGRTWTTAEWLVSFEDRLLMMYLLPLPDGPAVITTTVGSAQKAMYEWDVKKICDHTWAAYNASFADWNTFIPSHKLPNFLANLNFTWKSGGSSVSFNAGEVSLTINNGVFDWTDGSELFLAPSPYKENGALKFSVRRVILRKDSRNDDIATLYKLLKPDSRFGSDQEATWNDVVQEKFPFDGKPAVSPKDNTGSIGAVLTAPSKSSEVRYTLYLSTKNPQNEDAVAKRFTAFKTGIKIN